MNDNKLMILVKDGDEFAFRQLFDRYKLKITNYIYHLIYQSEVAEELAHDVFLKVYRKRDSFNEQFQFSTWLWRIARNTSWDYLKKKKELLIEDQNKTNKEEYLTEQMTDLSPRIDESLIEKASLLELKKAIGALSLKQREALSLRVYSELSYDEISIIMGVSIASVKTQIFRWKKELVKKLKANEEGHFHEK